MRTPEYGPVDPVTARSINQIEDRPTVCEECGLRGGRFVYVWKRWGSGEPSVIIHREHLYEDREERT